MNEFFGGALRLPALPHIFHSPRCPGSVLRRVLLAASMALTLTDLGGTQNKAWAESTCGRGGAQAASLRVY